MNKKKNIAIITGASSGFGREFTKLLIKDESLDEIFVLSRSNDKLEALKSELGEKIKPYIIDLSVPQKIKEFGEYLKTQNANVKILINNAGFAKFCFATISKQSTTSPFASFGSYSCLCR